MNSAVNRRPFSYDECQFHFKFSLGDAPAVRLPSRSNWTGFYIFSE